MKDFVKLVRMGKIVKLGDAQFNDIVRMKIIFQLNKHHSGMDYFFV